MGAGRVPAVAALAAPHVQVGSTGDASPCLSVNGLFMFRKYVVVVVVKSFVNRSAFTVEYLPLTKILSSQYFRPGEKITRKTIMMANKMKELDMKETSSKSLLSNVLDMDDDFRNTTLPTTNVVHHPSHVAGHQNGGFVRWKLRILREGV